MEKNTKKTKREHIEVICVLHQNCSLNSKNYSTFYYMFQKTLKKLPLPIPRHLKSFNYPALNSFGFILSNPNFTQSFSSIVHFDSIESPLFSLSKIDIATPTHYSIVMTFLVRECYGSPKKQEF